MDQLADFGLAVLPMVHVTSMNSSIAFYEALGAKLVFGSRDGDWVLLRFGSTHLSLLTHPPSPDNPGLVELQFTSRTPLERIEEHLIEVAPERIARGTADEAFGKTLQLRTLDGLIVKLIELEQDLIA